MSHVGIQMAECLIPVWDITAWYLDCDGSRGHGEARVVTKTSNSGLHQLPRRDLDRGHPPEMWFR